MTPEEKKEKFLVGVAKLAEECEITYTLSAVNSDIEIFGTSNILSDENNYSVLEHTDDSEHKVIEATENTYIGLRDPDSMPTGHLLIGMLQIIALAETTIGSADLFTSLAKVAASIIKK